MEEVAFSVKKLPHWTLWLPFLILAMSKVIAIAYFRVDNVVWIYLPYLLALPMYFWWGPRVFPPHFLAELLTAGLVGLDAGVVVIFYGLATASKVFMGYLLYKQICAKIPMKSVRGFWLFFFWVVVLQNIIGNFLFLSSYVQSGAYGSALFWRLYLINTLKDTLDASLVCYPALIYATKLLRERDWARNDFVL